MDVKATKESCKLRVYHLTADDTVPMHPHKKFDEIFYCIKGSGFGVLEDREIELNVGDTFVAPAGVLHSMRTDGELYVTALLVPVVNEAE